LHGLRALMAVAVDHGHLVEYDRLTQEVDRVLLLRFDMQRQEAA
jgi:hypothetical protein